MTPNQVAVFDTNAGFLQWVGVAADHAEAIRKCLAEAGSNEDVAYEFRAVDVTDEQAAALREWADKDFPASEYPEGIAAGDTYASA